MPPTPVYCYLFLSTIYIVIYYIREDFVREDLLNILLKQTIYTLFITGLFYWIYYIYLIKYGALILLLIIGLMALLSLGIMIDIKIHIMEKI